MLSVLFVFALNAAASAAEIPVQSNEQIIVRGVNAHVNYTVVPNATSLRVTEAAGWTWERREQVLEITGPEPDSRGAVAEALRAPPPRATVDIQGPSLPIEIQLREGAVQLTRGQHEARINLQQGRVVAQQRAAGLRVNGRKVDVTVADSSGRLDLDIYQGAVVLKNHQGDSDVDLFSGQFSADQEKGTLSLTTHTVTSRIQKFAGTLQLDLMKGSFVANGLQGRVEGQTAEGGVQLQLQPESEVNLRSQSGRVQIQLPPTSGAQLNVATGTGELLVPNELRVTRSATEKTARGKLKGEAGKIQVVVRSAEGSIIVK